MHGENTTRTYLTLLLYFFLVLIVICITQLARHTEFPMSLGLLERYTYLLGEVRTGWSSDQPDQPTGARISRSGSECLFNQDRQEHTG